MTTPFDHVDNHHRAATVIKVTDGDTVDVELDMGNFLYMKWACRMFGINAPEMKTPEGIAAKEYLSGFLIPGDKVVVETIKPDKYARRIDGVIWDRRYSTSLNQMMIDSGHAVPYDPSKKTT